MNDENIELEITDKADNLSNDELKKVISERMEQLRTQAMLIGAQVSAKVILDKINNFENMQGKKTMNDYKRLIKDIKHFCTVGLSRKVNNDGTTTKIAD